MFRKISKWVAALSLAVIGLANLVAQESTNVPPKVAIFIPGSGTVFLAPANIVVVANASDVDGTVSTVEFFRGTNSLGLTTNFPTLSPLGPFVLVWSNVPPGEYSLTAVATDNGGARSRSEPVRIAVREGSDTLPIVTIVASDAEAVEGTNTASNIGGINPGRFTINRTGGTNQALTVSMRIGGTASNGVDYAELASTATIPTGALSTHISVVPIDDNLTEDKESVVLSLVSNATYRVGSPSSATVYILDNDHPTNRPPSVVIVTPASGAMFIAPTDILLGANAPDDGRVVSLEFFAGDRLIAKADGPLVTPAGAWIAHWTNPAPGEYSITAKATDNLGAVGWSGPVRISVKPAGELPLVLVSRGANWKYLDNGSDQGTAWREPAFNDHEWKAGPAELGFGDGDEATLLRRGTNDLGFITYYFRRAFEIANPSNIASLTLFLLRDDGAVVYLNGKEVFRSNMPDGAIQFSTLALSTVSGDDERIFNTASIEPTLLASGRNVLAVEVHQAAITSSDISFNLELVARGPGPSPPIVNIEATDPEAMEQSPLIDAAPNPAVFIVRRSGGTNTPLTVFYRIGGTASNAVDYMKLSGEVTIPTGALSAQIVVNALDDLIIEDTETVVLTLIEPPCLAIFPPPPECYRLGERRSATAYIRDNDAPPPNHLPSVRIVRPTNGMTFPAPATIEIIVEARDPDGYVPHMEFFANERKIGEQDIVFIQKPPPGELQIFSLVWSNVLAGQYVLIAKATDDQGGGAASDPIKIIVGAIIETPIVTITATDPRAAEAGPDTGTFTVRRTGGTNNALTVFYRLDGSAVNGIDYQNLPGLVTIPAGALSAPIVVTPIDDDKAEGTERVVARLGPSPTAAPFEPYRIGSPSEAVVEIADNDVIETNRPPVVGIVAPDNGSSFIAPADILVIARATDSDGEVLTVEFFAGTNSIGIKTNFATLNLIGPFALFWNDVAPGEYALRAKATDNKGAMSLSEAVKVVVRSDSEPPVVTIAATDSHAAEAGPEVGVFTVKRNGKTNETLTVFYRLSGTASNGTDYETLPGMVRIPAGTWSAEIIVKPIDDKLVEGTESVGAKLVLPLSANVPGDVPPYRMGSPSEAVVYIADNDLPERERLPIVNIYARDSFASEGTNSMGTNTAVFVIRRSGETNSDLTVHYAIGGTASNGVDYVKVPNSVTIPAGRYSAQIVITPIDDNATEGIETVVLKLRVPETTPAPYVLGWYREAAAIITDNDAPAPLSVRLPGDLFHLCLPGVDGVSFRLEASTNLQDWVTIDTVTVVDGALHFVDSDAVAWKLRFYRAVPMPRPPPPEED